MSDTISTWSLDDKGGFMVDQLTICNICSQKENKTRDIPEDNVIQGPTEVHHRALKQKYFAAIFECRQVIGFALHDWFKNSRQFFIQSEVKAKSIVISRALRQLLVIRVLIGSQYCQGSL